MWTIQCWQTTCEAGRFMKNSINNFKFPRREMSILTNKFSPISCLDTYGGFQAMTTEHCASPVTFLIAFFCFDYQDNRALSCKRYSGWWSPAGHNFVIQDVKHTNLPTEGSWLQFLHGHFMEEELTPHLHRNINMFILLHFLLARNPLCASKKGNCKVH